MKTKFEENYPKYHKEHSIPDDVKKINYIQEATKSAVWVMRNYLQCLIECDPQNIQEVTKIDTIFAERIAVETIATFINITQKEKK